MTIELQAQWVVGFVDGEGCFSANVCKNPTCKFGYQIQVTFTVTQHKRDVQLLYALKKLFCCGDVSVAKVPTQTNYYRFRVRKLDHILDNVIPFFEKHCLKTKKNVEFKRFRKLCFLLKQKVHHEQEGFEQCVKLTKMLPLDTNPNETEL